MSTSKQQMFDRSDAVAARLRCFGPSSVLTGYSQHHVRCGACREAVLARVRDAVDQSRLLPHLVFDVVLPEREESIDVPCGNLEVNDGRYRRHDLRLPPASD